MTKMKERKAKKISNAHFASAKSKRIKRCRIDLNNLEEYMDYMTQENTE